MVFVKNKKINVSSLIPFPLIHFEVSGAKDRILRASLRKQMDDLFH
jgi:hypothetical protein